MRRLLLVLGLAFLVTGPLLAQTFGEIAGEVKDSSGAVIANVTVTATNTATNVSRVTQTNSSGIYTLPALVPGPYSVKAEANGFQSQVRPGIQLQVQQSARIDFSMAVGQVTETVEVSGSAALLATQDATVGTVIENRRIVELPLNGRNFLQLVSLSPNVSSGFTTPGQAGGRQGGTRANENISISGVRGTWNHYTLDGIENTDVNFNLYIVLPSIDALQEFKVQSGIYPAEFGRGAGQVNVSTKPGTNDFHGVAYEFLRNSKLDARQYDFIGTAPVKQPFRWNQYGFTLGGPVWIPKLINGRNRLFFMSNFEGYRERRTTNTRGTFPTLAMRAGDFTGQPTIYDPLTTCGTGSNGPCPVGSNGQPIIQRQPFPNNKIPTNRFDPISLKLMEFWAVPNVNTSVLLDNYQTPLSNPIDKDQFTQRIDFNERDSSQWFGRYSWTDEKTTNPGIMFSGTKLYTRARQYMGSNTRVLSASKVNELRFGVNTFYNVIGQELGGVRNVVEEVGLPFKYPDPETWGIPTIRGMTGGLSGFGNGTNGPFVMNDKIIQVVDNFSWGIGRHSLRMGGEYRWDKFKQAGNEFGRPVFEFNSQYTRSQILNAAGVASNTGGSSAADFLLGTPSRGDVSIALAEADFRANNLAFYFDDIFRISSKVTLNLGLRWEMTQPWKDKIENQINLDFKMAPAYTGPVADMSLHPTLVRTGSGDFYQGKDFRYVGVQTARDGRITDRLMETDWNNFAPRFGLAYSPNERLSIRTGFGVFYSVESGNSRFDMNRGLAGRAGQLPGPTVPTLSYTNLLAGASLPVQLSAPFLWGVKPNVRTSYSMMYLLNIQKQLTNSMALEVGYNGAQHRKLQFLQNMNPAIPGSTTAYRTRAMFPEFGTLQVVNGEGQGNYNGLGAKLTQRYSQGMTVMASYTWSKAMDYSSAIRGNSGDIFPQDSTCLRCDYGPSAYNTPHRFVTSGMYELPFGKGKPIANVGGVVNHIVGGWQIGSIITIQSGRPINTGSWDAPGQQLFGETRLNTNGLDPYFPSSTRGANGWLNKAAFYNTAPGTFGNVGRNALIGPTTWAWDFSTIKNFQIVEGQQLQFRYEAFNFPNHPALGSPNAGWGSANPTPAAGFGLIRSTAGRMREMQFALKYIF